MGANVRAIQKDLASFEGVEDVCSQISEGGRPVDTGVTVTALMPGPTDTEFFRRADMEDTKVGQSAKDDPAQVAHEAMKRSWPARIT